MAISLRRGLVARPPQRCARPAVPPSSVFRLLGAGDLGVAGDYRTALMPPPLTDLLEGELTWRLHTGGHEDRSNMTPFVNWVDRHIGREDRPWRAVMVTAAREPFPALQRPR